MMVPGKTGKLIAAGGKGTGEMPMRRTILNACVKMLAAGAVWATRSRTAQACSTRRVKWIAYYGQTADEQILASYDIVVLDPMFEGSIAAVAKAGAQVYGYLSLGEIRVADVFYGELDPAALLEENPSWPGTYRVDVRHEAWMGLVLKKMVPAVVARGFTGIMLDTLDTPPYLEQIDPIKNRGMHLAAVELVHAIHVSFPSMALIMNRGYDLLPSVIGSLNGIIAESLLTSPDQHQSGLYKWNEPSQVALGLSLLAPALQWQTCPFVLSLDYWDPDDTQTIKEIYRLQRQLGHQPYVATPMLDNVVPVPN